MNILALDLSGHTGWAAGDSRERPAFGTIDLPKSGDDVGAFLSAYYDWLYDKLDEHHFDRVVFESPILPFRRSHIKVVRKLMGLAGVTEMVCTSYQGVGRLKCSEVTIQQAKLFLAGSGRADKIAMVKAARIFGFDVQNDNEADAVALWGFASAWLAPKDAQASAIFSMGHLGANR